MMKKKVVGTTQGVHQGGARTSSKPLWRGKKKIESQINT